MDTEQRHQCSGQLCVHWGNGMPGFPSFRCPLPPDTHNLFKWLSFKLLTLFGFKGRRTCAPVHPPTRSPLRYLSFLPFPSVLYDLGAGKTVRNFIWSLTQPDAHMWSQLLWFLLTSLFRTLATSSIFTPSFGPLLASSEKKETVEHFFPWIQLKTQKG